MTLCVLYCESQIFACCEDFDSVLLSEVAGWVGSEGSQTSESLVSGDFFVF
jgi:hypothetical protein